MNWNQKRTLNGTTTVVAFVVVLFIIHRIQLYYCKLCEVCGAIDGAHVNIQHMFKRYK